MFKLIKSRHRIIIYTSLSVIIVASVAFVFLIKKSSSFKADQLTASDSGSALTTTLQANFNKNSLNADYTKGSSKPSSETTAVAKNGFVDAQEASLSYNMDKNFNEGIGNISFRFKIPTQPKLQDFVSNPRSMVYDQTGNFLYIADTGHNRIIRIQPDGKNMTTLGTRGKGVKQFESPTGISYDSKTGWIYVADYGLNRVVRTKIDGSGWAEMKMKGTALKNPSDILYIPEEDAVLIADTGNKRVVKTNMAGTIWQAIGDGFYETFARFDKNSVVKHSAGYSVNGPLKLNYDSKTKLVYIYDPVATVKTNAYTPTYDPKQYKDHFIETNMSTYKTYDKPDAYATSFSLPSVDDLNTCTTFWYKKEKDKDYYLNNAAYKIDSSHIYTLDPSSRGETSTGNEPQQYVLFKSANNFSITYLPDNDHVNDQIKVTGPWSDGLNSSTVLGNIKNNLRLNDWNNFKFSYNYKTGEKIIYLNGVDITRTYDDPRKTPSYRNEDHFWDNVLEALAEIENHYSYYKWLPVLYPVNPNDRITFSDAFFDDINLSSSADLGQIQLVQTASQEIKVGATATFNTGVLFGPNSDTLRYQWQKNGKDIPGATQSSYTTPQVQLGDNGSRYRVKISYGGDDNNYYIVLPENNCNPDYVNNSKKCSTGVLPYPQGSIDGNEATLTVKQ